MPLCSVIYLHAGDIVDPRAYCGRSVAYRSIGKHDESFADFTKAIECNPTYIQGLYGRGDENAQAMYYEMNYGIDSIDDYLIDSIVTGIEPAFAKVLYIKMDQSVGGRDDAALTESTKTKRVDSKEKVNYFSDNKLHPKVERVFNNIIVDCNKAININRKDPVAYYHRGSAYLAKKEGAKALSDFTKAIKLYPEWGRAYQERGQIYFLMGEKDKAEADFKKAIEYRGKGPPNRTWFRDPL